MNFRIWFIVLYALAGIGLTSAVAEVHDSYCHKGNGIMYGLIAATWPVTAVKVTYNRMNDIRPTEACE